MKGKLIFQEEQSFKDTWMFYVVMLVIFLSIAGAVLSVWHSESVTEGLIGVGISAVVGIGILILFLTSKLYVTIDEDTIYYRYPPFVNSEKTISKEDIKEVFVRKYKPIWEYGGWGYRINLKNGRALNVAGNVGLQLVLTKEKRLLIGTQKPEEMERAIRRLKDNWGING